MQASPSNLAISFKISLPLHRSSHRKHKNKSESHHNLHILCQQTIDAATPSQLSMDGFAQSHAQSSLLN